MDNYRESRRRHEAVVIDGFVDWLNRTSGSNWTVTARPNPPDAIIADGLVISWIEHADLYRSGEEARSETSFVAPGKPHIPHSEHPIHEPDQRTAKAFMNVLQDKLSNGSYQTAYEKYGRGFLLISERDLLFDNSTIAEIHRVTEELVVVGDKGYFCKVYLAIRVPQAMVYCEVTYRKG